MKKNNTNKILTQKKGVATKISLGVIFTIISLFCLFLLFMLFWALLTSLKNYYDFGPFGHNVVGFPNIDANVSWNSREHLFQFKNYQTVFANLKVPVKSNYYVGSTLVSKAAEVGFLEMVLNTLLYCGLGAFCNVLVYNIAGFLVGKYKEFKFGAILEMVIIAMMAIPTISSTAAEIDFLRNVGLFDTWLGHIFLSSNFAGVYALVFMATFRNMPDGYIEAAEIDGASQLRIFLSIAIPLQIKLSTTVFLLNFISFWNIYESPLLYFPTHPTLAVGMFKMEQLTQGEFSRIPVKLASCMVFALPILIVFCFLHEKIMGKVSLGGLKE